MTPSYAEKAEAGKAYMAITVYVKKHKKRHRESLEQIISKDAYYSYFYARNVIKGRWKLGEAAISEDAIHSYFYARDIIKRRFVLGEAAISESPWYIHAQWWYAYDVIKGNWTPELAMMCPYWLYIYAKDVIKGRLPTVMHNKMISFGIIDSKNKYVKKYLGAKKYCTLKRKDTKNDSRSSV